MLMYYIYPLPDLCLSPPPQYPHPHPSELNRTFRTKLVYPWELVACAMLPCARMWSAWSSGSPSSEHFKEKLFTWAHNAHAAHKPSTGTSRPRGSELCKPEIRNVIRSAFQSSRVFFNMFFPSASFLRFSPDSCEYVSDCSYQFGPGKSACASRHGSDRHAHRQHRNTGRAGCGGCNLRTMTLLPVCWIKKTCALPWMDIFNRELKCSRIHACFLVV